jgi:LacI family transcriptional regulator
MSLRLAFLKRRIVAACLSRSAPLPQGPDPTPASRRGLLRGLLDAVIVQDAGHEARSAIRVLLSLARREPILAEQEKIRVEIAMRDNLP